MGGFCNGSVPTNVSDSFYGISQSNDYQFYDYKLFDTNSERNCSKDSPDWEECENTLNPLSLLYLVFYVVLIIFQSIGMVLHRWQNMVIYSATANITKTKQQLESMPEGIRKTISKKTRAALEYFSLRYNSDFEGDYRQESIRETTEVHRSSIELPQINVSHVNESYANDRTHETINEY